MPSVKIGNNSKKLNSTSRSYTVSATLSCRLKEPCSMQAPVFKVQGLTKGQIFNYCEFEGRYYWVDDVIYLTNNIQELHCHMDVLATYKTDIGNTYAFVEYGDHTHWEMYLDDPRFSPEVEVAKGRCNGYKMFNRTSPGTAIDIEKTYSEMTVVFTVWDGDSGVLRTYAIPPVNFLAIVASLSNATDPTNVSTATSWTDLDFAQYIEQIITALCGQGSWCDNLISAKLLPLNYLNVYSGKYNGQPSTIWFGGVSASVSGMACEYLGVYGHIERGTYNITLPWDSVTDYYNGGVDFLKNSRWCAMQINVAGQYRDIDVTNLRNQSSIPVYWSLDTFTGDWDMRICEGNAYNGNTKYEDESMTIASFNGTLGSDIKSWVGTGLGNKAATAGLLTGIVNNLIGATAAKVTAAQSTSNTEAIQDDQTASNGTVSPSAIAGGVVTTASGIFGVFPHTSLSASSPSGSGSSGLTNLYLLNDANVGYLYITGKQWVFNDYGHYGYGDPVAYPNCFCDEYGYPVHKYLKISSCSGYVSCVGASVKNSKASPANLSTINNFLNTGFYYE